MADFLLPVNFQPILSNSTFLVTGGAGFIGSHIVEYLLINGAKKVRVLDNFSTGSRDNIKGFDQFSSFEMVEGDIRNPLTCMAACEGINLVCHQAALGSVPRSINDPSTTHDVNITGFLNMLMAVKENNVSRFVYAASSSTYGDSAFLPKKEDIIGKPLSPYAVTKLVNELYAHVFGLNYGVKHIGLRYFNIFGPRQSPNGAYAAVIPLFIKAIKEGNSPIINGDGSNSRDFTYVDNAVFANILSLCTDNEAALNQVYNIACNKKFSLNELWSLLCEQYKVDIKPIYGPARNGDVKDSLADISKAVNLLTYKVMVDFKTGLKRIC
jgi:UDP-N-acetylglucosamine 4-epimerase